MELIKKIKRAVYYSLPKPLRKTAKNLYFDYFVFPIYRLKYKLHYNTFDFFSSIAIETTTYCNLRCKNCPNSIYERGILKNKKLMPMFLFKKIINELAEINYCGEILLHFYGEPLTDARLPLLVSYAKQKIPKAKIHINTNGFLLTPDIYKKLIHLGIEEFLITQYGKEMPNNVKKVVDYLKTRPKKENKIKYRILGEDILLSNRGGELKIDNSVDYERPICLYPNTAVHIDYQGNLVLCCNDYHSSITFGNLNKENLVDIWNKENYKNLRKQLRKKIFKLPICRKCVGLDLPQYLGEFF